MKRVRALRLLTVSAVAGLVLSLVPALPAAAVDLCRCVDHDCRKTVCIKPW
ncbi:MAG: hypothetical protein ACRDI1_02185 [Actinomycetota bacterium]